jgi:hypothetical protein
MAPGDDPDPVLRSVERDYPGWVAWHGVSGLVYARRVKTTPPVVVRAADVPALRALIEGALKGRRP